MARSLPELIFFISIAVLSLDVVDIADRGVVSQAFDRPPEPARVWAAELVLLADVRVAKRFDRQVGDKIATMHHAVDGGLGHGGGESWVADTRRGEGVDGLQVAARWQRLGSSEGGERCTQAVPGEIDRAVQPGELRF